MASVNLQRVAFVVAVILFAFVGLFVMSGCQSYQPPGGDLWRAL